MVPPLIELTGATKRFPSGSGSVHTAVRDLTMTVQPGEFVAVVGPTGCGKSTTLSLVSGLQPPSAGRVQVNGEDVKSIPDGVGYMFQTDAVLPWRSVLDNVAIRIGQRYDIFFGGMNGTQKFTQPQLAELLWRAYLRTGMPQFLQVSSKSLDAMLAAGLYDHVGGG